MDSCLLLTRPSMNTLAKVALAAYLGVNAKNLLFAWHVRFFYYFFRYLFLPENLLGYPEADLPTSPFAESRYDSRCNLMELDINIHKSNATYFEDLDSARTKLIVWVLNRFLKDSKQNDGSWAFIPIGSVYCNFKNEIAPLQKYTMASRVIGWDHKWFFVESQFEMNDPANPTIAATAITKYVIKDGRRTVPPGEAFRRAGYAEEDILRGFEEFKRLGLQRFIDIEEIGGTPRAKL